MDLRRYSLSALRERLGIVTQDTRLFSGTILENVRLFDASINEDAVLRACQIACLHETIEQMPMSATTRSGPGACGKFGSLA